MCSMVEEVWSCQNEQQPCLSETNQQPPLSQASEVCFPPAPPARNNREERNLDLMAAAMAHNKRGFLFPKISARLKVNLWLSAVLTKSKAFLAVLALGPDQILRFGCIWSVICLRTAVSTPASHTHFTVFCPSLCSASATPHTPSPQVADLHLVYVNLI